MKEKLKEWIIHKLGGKTAWEYKIANERVYNYSPNTTTVICNVEKFTVARIINRSEKMESAIDDDFREEIERSRLYTMLSSELESRAIGEITRTDISPYEEEIRLEVKVVC